MTAGKNPVIQVNYALLFMDERHDHWQKKLAEIAEQELAEVQI
jgi:hypothetical protein